MRLPTNSQSRSITPRPNETRLSTVLEQASPTLPRVALDTQRSFPAPMHDAWVTVEKRPASPTSIYSDGVAPRPDSPASVHSDGAVAQLDSPTSIYSVAPDSRSSVETVRPLKLKQHTAVAEPSERRHSLDIASEFLGGATDARVARGIILQYTVPEMRKHPDNVATQASVAAQRISNLRQSPAAAKLDKQLMSDAFLDAYQTVIESLGNSAPHPACVTELPDSGRSSPVERPSSRVSNLLKQARPTGRLMRSLSTMSLGGLGDDRQGSTSRTQPSSPEASTVDLTQSGRPFLPRSMSSLSFRKR